MSESATASPDRGLQPERTVLSWTRTSLSVVASGVLVLLKDRGTPDPSGHAVRLGIGSAAAILALAVFASGMLRRRALAVRPLPPRLRDRNAVLLAGTSVVALTLIVVTYLVLGV
jgi:uncharacterized membrane protein YidH (DUF202 family)